MIPKVSIILPTYNRCHLVSEAIQSVLDQNFIDFELIVINDGSTDRTTEVLNEYQKRDQRIKVVHQENIGVAKSLNKGIKLARGKYIARIDDDDLWTDPKKLEKQVKFLEENPDYILVGGGVITINEKGKELFRDLLPEKDELIRKKMLFKCPFVHPSVVFKKINGFLYREDLRCAEDWEFWMRLGKKGKMYNFQEYFVKHRFHKKNVSVLFNISQIKEGIKIIKSHRNDYPNYFRALIYNYGKLFFFSLPFSQTVFRKFLVIKKRQFNVAN